MKNLLGGLFLGWSCGVRIHNPFNLRNIIRLFLNCDLVLNFLSANSELDGHWSFEVTD